VQMPRDSGKRNAKWFGQSGDAPFGVAGEAFHDAAAGGIGESRKNV